MSIIHCTPQGRFARVAQLIVGVLLCALATRVAAQSPIPFESTLERLIWKSLGPWTPLVNNTPSSASVRVLDDDGEPMFDIFGGDLYRSPFDLPSEEVTDYRAWAVTAFEAEFGALVNVGECTFSEFGDFDEYNQGIDFYGYDGPRARLCKGPGNTRVSPPDAALLSPVGLAVYGTRVYVSDNFNHRVTAFDFYGNPIPLANKIGTGVPGRGSESDYTNVPAGHMLNAPEGVAVDAAGSVMVADSYNKRIAVFDATGAFQFEYNLPDGIATWFKPGRLAITPGAVVTAPGTTPADPNARLVVVDTTHCQVRIMGTAFNVIADQDQITTLPQQLPEMMEGPSACTNPEFATPAGGEFSTATGVTIDHQSRIYITDHAMSAVQVFDKTGTHLGEIGKPEEPSTPGDLSGPVGLAFDHLGRLGVIDAGNSRTVFYSLEFDENGAPEATFEFELDTTISVDDFPMALAEQVGPSPADDPETAFDETSLNDPKGRFLATDPLKRRVLRFELPEIAIVDASAVDGEANFLVAVPRQKVSPVREVVVTADVVETSGVEITSPGLTPTVLQDIPAGSAVPYTFPYEQTVSRASFKLNAKGDFEGGDYLAKADEVIVSSLLSCDGCEATHVVYNHPSGGTPTPAVLHESPENGEWYGQEVFVRITPEPGEDAGSIVSSIEWYVTGPAAAVLGEGPTISQLEGGVVDVIVRVAGESTLVYRPISESGGHGAVTEVLLPIDLEVPGVEIELTEPSGTDPSNVAWNNTDVEGTWYQEDDYSGALMVEGSVSFTEAESPEGRDFSVPITLADYAMHTATISSAAVRGGRSVNIDRTAPEITTERDEVTVVAGPGGFAVLGANPFGASAVDPELNDTRPGSTESKAGSGVVNNAVLSSHLADFQYPVATTTVTLTAVDYAGNVATKEVTVTVLPRSTTAIEYTGAVTVQYGHDLPVSAVVTPEHAIGNVTFSFGSRTLTADLGEGAITAATIAEVVNNVGTYEMTVSYSPANADFDAVSTTVQIVVTAAPLKIKADAKSRPYGGASATDLPLTYTLEGQLYNGDELTGSLKREPGSDAGTYAILQDSLAATSNYDVSYVGANYVITQLPITVTADDKSKSLLTGDPPLTYQVTAGALVAGDSFSGVLTRAGNDLPGVYPIEQGTLTAGPNYVLTYRNGWFTIATVVITVTADPISKMYGEPEPPLTFSFEGILPLGVEFEGALTRGPGEDRGNYGISQGSLSLPSYIIWQFHSNTFRITPRPASVTAGSGSKTFGEDDPALSVTKDGFLDSDVMTIGVSRTTGETAGIYSTIPTADGEKINNYDVGYISGTFTINKATVTVTAQPASMIYGDDPELTFVYGPLPNGFTAAQIDTPPTCSVTGDLNVGAHAIVCSGGADHDVNFTYVGATLTVNPRPATLTAGSGNKVFGASEPTLSITQTGILEADLSGITLKTTRVAGEDVGDYVTTADATGGASGNYSFTKTPGNFSITPATAVVSVTGATVTYDANEHLAECRVTGGDGNSLIGTLTYTPGSGAPRNAGTYTATCRFAGDGNHPEASASASITINRKDAAVTASNRSKVYGETLTINGNELTTSGFVGGDTVTGATIASAGAAAAATAGPHPITIDNGVGVGLDNYNISYVDGTLSVSKAIVTITASSHSLSYGSPVPTIVPSFSGFVAGETELVLTASPGCTTVYTETSAGGSSAAATCSGAAAANYDFEYVNGAVTVAKLPVVVSVSGGPFTYDGATHGATCSVTAADNATLTGTLSYTPAGTPRNAGSYTALCTFDESGSHQSGSSSATIVIDPKPITVTADSRSKTYGQLVTFAGTEFTAPGLVTGDSITLVSLTSTGASATAGASTSPYAIVASAANGTGLSNYQISYADGALTVDKATLTVKADNKSKSQGDPNPVLTATITGFAGTDTQSSAVTGSPALSTTADAGSAVGSYPITAALGSLAAANYTFTFTGGTLTVEAGAPPNLTLVKSANKTTTSAGDTLVYTLTYANSGSSVSTATNVVISDAVPANTTFVSATGGGALASGKVTWTIPSLAANATGSVTLTVKVNSNVSVCNADRGSHRHGDNDDDDDDHRRGRNGHHRGDRCDHDDDDDCVKSISNVATIKSTQVTAPKSSNTVTTSVGEPPKPVLTLTKSVNKTTAAAGDTLVYTMAYTNTGAGAATNVVITDSAPSDTAYVSNTGGGVVSSGNVNWTIASVAPGASGSVTMTVKVNTSVSVCGAKGSDSHRHGDDDDDDRDHRNNRRGHYRGDRCDHDDDDDDCVKSIANTAKIKATNFSSKTSNTATTNLVVMKPNLTLTTSVNKTTASAGDTLVYTLTYANTGSGAASNVVISDGAPSNTTYQSNTGGGSVSSGNVTWTIPTLAAGATGTITMTVKVNSSVEACGSSNGGSHRHGDNDDDDRDHRNGRKGHHRGDRCDHDDDEDSCVKAITNSASIKATSVSSKSSNTVSTPVVAPPKPNLTLTTSVSKTTASAGDTLVYTLTYANTGSGAASNVVISDGAPSNTTYQSNTGGGSVSSGNVTWSIAAVAPGATGSVTMTVKVNSNVSICRTGGSHRAGDNDDDDRDHRNGRNGHRGGDGCSHDNDCVSLVTNQASIKAHQMSAKDSNTVTTNLVRTNRAPSAVNDTVTTIKNTSKTFVVLGNDSDPDGDQLSISSFTQPASSKGSVAKSSNNTFTFTPKNNATGTATFTYTISDGEGGTDTATVTITINAKHSDDDDCDHDHGRNGHRDGDGCDHDDDVKHHHDGDNCDHDKGKKGHRDGDNCEHDRHTGGHHDGDGDDHDRGKNGHRDGDGCEHDRSHRRRDR